MQLGKYQLCYYSFMLFRLFFGFFLFFAFFVFSFFWARVLADELDEIERQLAELSRAREASVNATKPLEGQLHSLTQTLKRVQNSILKVEGQLAVKQKELQRLEASIAHSEVRLGERKSVFYDQLHSYYLTIQRASPVHLLFTSRHFGDFTRSVAYYQYLLEEQERVIKAIGAEIRSLQDDKETVEKLKKELESEGARLALVKQRTSDEADFYAGEIAKAKKYQEELSGKIAVLSARQKQLLAERSGSFVTSVGDVPLTDDPNASPTFHPGFSPAFAGFSFGAYTHRKGMSQYGAKGRAESGQNADQIIQAYYGKTPVTVDTSGTISVVGVGSVDFEKNYLMGIAEMPSNFPQEALRAQAIAARSYAYRYKQAGKPICTTQACQVYLPSKAAHPPAAWRQAVEDTRGKIIDGVVAYYSSTTGGYITTSGWDTKCGSQNCWTGDAYERLAGSPWFYKGWYTQGYSITSAKCNRLSPWLTEEEFADIINAWIVRKHSGDTDRILPVTIGSCPIGGAGNPFSMAELRDRAGQYGGAVTSVSSVSVTYSTSGFTSMVYVQSNRGKLSIPGPEFHETFNLRAPGYISLRSPLYNIEQK